jgi:uncharacterized protein YggT (Ycf19 family)
MFTVFQLLQIALGVWMWTLLGRAVLWMLIPGDPRSNPIYRVMSLVCWPILAPLRALLPRSVPEAHLGFYALVVVVLLRLGTYMLFYSQGWIPGVGGAAP